MPTTAMSATGDIHHLGHCWCKMYHSHGYIFSDNFGLTHQEYPRMLDPDVLDQIQAAYLLLDEIDDHLRKQHRNTRYSNAGLESAAMRLRLHLMNVGISKEDGR